MRRGVAVTIFPARRSRWASLVPWLVAAALFIFVLGVGSTQ